MSNDIMRGEFDSGKIDFDQTIKNFFPQEVFDFFPNDFRHHRKECIVHYSSLEEYMDTNFPQDFRIKYFYDGISFSGYAFHHDAPTGIYFGLTKVNVIPCAFCGGDVYISHNNHYTEVEHHKKVDGIFFCSDKCAERMTKPWAIMVMVKARNGQKVYKTIAINADEKSDLYCDDADMHIDAKRLFSHPDYNQMNGYYLFSVSMEQDICYNAIRIEATYFLEEDEN